MKRVGWLVLLLSLGLNLGLGLRLLNPNSSEPAATTRTGRSYARGEQRWERPAPGDSASWGRFIGRRMKHLAQRLDLRPEQIDALRSVQQAALGQMRQRRLAVAEARNQLRDLMSEESIDQAAVRRAISELGRRQAAMDSLAAESVLLELELLDPAQRAGYLEFLPDHGGRRQGRERIGRRGPRN